MAEIIIPSIPKGSGPLFQAIGLTSRESDAVYFEVTEALQTGKSVAEVLLMLEQSPKLNVKQKIWGAYNLKTEILKRKGVPKMLIDKLEP